jgi:hypothetical protein
MGSPNQPSNATPSYSCPAGGGNVSTSLAISKTTVVKNSAGAVIRAIVTVAGSGAGGIYDCTATAAAVTANQIAVLPATVGPVDIEFPCMVGIFVVPGSGQQAAVSYQ